MIEIEQPSKASLLDGNEIEKSGLKTNGKGIIIVGLVSFCTLFFGVGIWFGFANLSGAVIAAGSVAVQGQPKTVQHIDGGIASQIKVANGSRVKKGDVLIRLDSTLLEFNLQIYKARLSEIIARKARLTAERDGHNHIVWEDELLEIFGFTQSERIKNGHKRLFEVRKSTLKGQIDQLNQQIEQFHNQIEGTAAIKSSKRREINLVKEELGSIEILKGQGLATNARIFPLKREVEIIESNIKEHETQLATILNSISETEIQILQVAREARQSVLVQLQEAEQELNETSQQLHATMEQLSRIEIKAPVEGIVHALSAFTEGGVIEAGSTIMQIIPQNDKLVIEANIEPQFVSQIYSGQSAMLRFLAFDQAETPELEGEIESISANIIVDQQTGASFYRLKIRVSDTEINRLDGIHLIVGMPVEAFLKTEERTALNYLIKPLSDYFKKALLEE